MKCKCSNDLYKISIVADCGQCESNGAWDEDAEEYIYDSKTIDTKNLLRDEVEENGECQFGEAFGDGCYMFTCNSCGEKSNVAMRTD